MGEEAPRRGWGNFAGSCFTFLYLNVTLRDTLQSFFFATLITRDKNKT
jgi:hypothetical protein